MRLAALGPLHVSAIGLGCMGMSAYYGGADRDAGAINTIHRAIDLGVTHFDTAEIYGPFTNEELLGHALAGRRDDVAVATKFGQLTHTDGPLPAAAGIEALRTRDGRADNVRAAVEGSLRRLRTDRVDLYYQHWPDPNTPIEETVGALAELVAQGKIIHIGLSNADPELVRRAHAVHPVAAVQSQYSLLHRDPEDVLLPVLRELGIGFVAYSPIGQGLLSGRIRSAEGLDPLDVRRRLPRFAGEQLRRNLDAVAEVEAVAREVDATAAQVALAWLLAQGDDLASIPGTTRIDRIEENIGALRVELDAHQLARLDALRPEREVRSQA